MERDLKIQHCIPVKLSMSSGMLSIKDCKSGMFGMFDISSSGDGVRRLELAGDGWTADRAEDGG